MSTWTPSSIRWTTTGECSTATCSSHLLSLTAIMAPLHLRSLTAIMAPLHLRSLTTIMAPLLSLPYLSPALIRARSQHTNLDL